MLDKIKDAMLEYGWSMDDDVDAFMEYLDIHLFELEQQFDAMSGGVDRIIDIASLGFVIDVIRALKEHNHE